VPNFDIEGLPSSFSELKNSATYIFLSPLDNQVIEFALQAISSTSSAHLFILSSQIELFYESPYAINLNTLHERGKVHSFSFDYAVAQKKKLNFTNNLLNELKVYDELVGSSVILHIHTDLFTRHTQAQLAERLKHYEKFAKKYQLTFIFIITGIEVAQVRRDVQVLNKYFDGIIYISNDAAVRSLEYDYWSYNEGVKAGESVQLEVYGERFRAVNKTELVEQNPHQNFDEDDVWLVKTAVPEGTKLPVFYKTVADNEALFKHGKKVKAATLVFAVTRYTDLATLASQCFSLRNHCGKKLKLVVQNVDGIIRHQDECLFLTLGVNLILYSFSEPSRLLSQIQSIQGFQFSRPLPSNIEEVLKYSESSLAKGFLPLNEFAKQVLNYSDSASNMGVSGVLVVLRLLPRIDAIHPLQLFHVKREGDVFSTVDDQVYLYLHACREHDVENAIKHLFKLKVADFFDSKIVIADHFFIQQECRRLKNKYAAVQVPDYTMQLQDNTRHIFDKRPADTAKAKVDSPEFRKVTRPFATRCLMSLKDSTK